MKFSINGKIRKTVIALLAAIACCLLIAGCANPQKELLAEPQNLRVEDEVLVWDEVEHAAGYIVRIDGETHETEGCGYDLSSFTRYGTYEIEVMAQGGGTQYVDSLWVSTQYTVQEETPTPGLRYQRINETEWEVSRGNANLAGRIVIPDEYQGFPVTAIAGYAFVPMDQYGNTVSNTSTTSVRLPSYLRTIGLHAFDRCLSLEKVNIPPLVKKIETHAFDHCKKLTKINLPQELTEIGSFAFFCCSFTEIVLPESVTSIGQCAFKGNQLRSVTLPSDLESLGYQAFEGTPWDESLAADEEGYIVLFGDMLYKHRGDFAEGTVVTSLPSRIKKIAGGAFADCKGLKEITLPQGLTRLEGHTFYGCSSLEQIHLPESLTYIGSYAFFGTALSELTIPDSVTIIGANAFGDSKKQLTSVNLSSNLEYWDGIKDGCDNVSYFILPISLKYLGYIPKSIPVYYEGTRAQWARVERDIRSPYLKVYYYSDEAPQESGKYWHYAFDGVTPVIWE